MYSEPPDFRAAHFLQQNPENPEFSFSLLDRHILFVIILSLTVSRLKNRCIPCVFWVTAIFAVVTKYSNLFFPFTFFLNGSHAAFGYELIICSETTDFMEIIRDKLSSV